MSCLTRSLQHQLKAFEKSASSLEKETARVAEEKERKQTSLEKIENVSHLKNSV
jgi:prefoldin subunit 5